MLSSFKDKWQSYNAFYTVQFHYGDLLAQKLQPHLFNLMRLKIVSDLITRCIPFRQWGKKTNNKLGYNYVMQVACPPKTIPNYRKIPFK